MTVGGGGEITLSGDGSFSFSGGGITGDTAGNLTASGDIEITDTAKGVILKSLGGTRYRIKVADDGTLSTEVP